MEKTQQKESRENQAEKVITFLRRIGAFEFFQKLKNNNELANEVTYEEYKNFLVRINGIARNIPISDRKLDGDGVTLEGLIDSALVPQQEDKELLLEESFTSRTFLQNPEDNAYLLPAILTAVHPFSDGNGRTSRVLHTLLIQHSSEKDFEEVLRKALGEDGRFDTPDINPSYLNSDITEIIWNKNGLVEGELPDNLTHLRTMDKVTNKKAKEFSRKFDIDNRYCFIAMYKYLKSKQKLEQAIKLKSDFTSSKLPDDYKAISLSKMEELFSDEDWNNLLNEYYELKKASVETLMDIFIHPDNYKIPDTNTTLRDKFISKVTKNLVRCQI